MQIYLIPSTIVLSLITLTSSLNFLMDPEPEEFKCPKFICKDKSAFDKHICAHSIAIHGQDPIVNLNKGGCQDKRICAFNLNWITLNDTVDFQCIETEKPDDYRKRFPGEECDDEKKLCMTSEEFPDIGICKDGLCTGRKEKEACNDHFQCTVGTFCNGKTCEKQKMLNEACSSTYHCLNNLGCLNHTCIELNSLPNGTYLGSDAENLEYFCDSGLVDFQTNQCGEIDYYNSVPNKDGFVPCTFNQYCNYTSGLYKDNGELEIFIAGCECGYNDKGMNYCLLPTKVNKQEWKKYWEKRNAIFDNKCHTLARYKCYAELSEKKRREYNEARMRTKDAHVFYASEKCAEILAYSRTGYLESGNNLLKKVGK